MVRLNLIALAFAGALGVAATAAPPTPQPENDTAGAEECDRLWRQTRDLYKQAESSDESGAKAAELQRAIEIGRDAVRHCPDRVESHYWLGASYGSYAELKGGLTAWRLVGKIRNEMEAAVRLQPDYEDGDAYLALGELDLGVPSIFGGNKNRGIRMLEQGLRVAPGNFDIRLALARAYLGSDRRAKAVDLLQSIRDAQGPSPPAPDVRQEAEDLLRKLEPAGDRSRLPASPGDSPEPR